MSDNDLKATLEIALVRQVRGAIGVTGLSRLTGGASQETWAFTLETTEGPRNLILRRAPGDSAARLATEARAIRAARFNGVTVPEIVYVLRPEDGAGQGYVMDRIEGETLPRKILRDATFDRVRPLLARQCGEVLAHIHATSTAGIEGLEMLDGPTQLSRYRDLYLSYAQPKPVFELAFAWLRDKLTMPSRTVLVHGDFRHGNLMIHPASGLAAVLDWELAHVGDPLEDMGWLCVNSWRFGVTDKRVGGFGHAMELLEGYVAAGGTPFAEEDLTAWEILGTLKWGIMCMTMYEAFRSGLDRSVERAAIGRRSSECEIDLINLLARQQS